MALPVLHHEDYERQARIELRRWQELMSAPPGMWSQATRGLQRRINGLIPERVHQTVTSVIKQMTRAVIAGSSFTAPAPLLDRTLSQREVLIAEKIENYSRTAAIEGGVTGAGGFFLGLADFPLLLSIKLKLLFDIGALYGFAGEDYKERVYLLHVFQLAFSSDAHRLDVYNRMLDWPAYREQLPASLGDFDWRTFQQEYRDYIDLAKLAQLLPIVGAPVGVIVNNRMVRRLGRTAINSYRMRWFADDSATANVSKS
jgi:EcsC family protein